MNIKTDFKPGDQVFCINNRKTRSLLYKNGVYTIESVNHLSSQVIHDKAPVRFGTTVTLVEVPNYAWAASRFELVRPVTEPVTEPASTIPEQGRKDDFDKLRYDLLPDGPIQEIVEVLTFGAKKYAPDNWRKVEDGHSRYYAALQRHLAAWRMGERNDPESGLTHLAHAACCLLFLIELDQT